jgi:flagellar FliL protein
MTDETAPAEPLPAKTGPGKGALLGLAAAGLVAGLAAGALLIAPRLAPSASSAGADSTVRDAEPHQEAAEAKGPMLRMENIIVNPAGSQGTRFLMATVAVQVPDEAARARLQSREVELRDTLVATLESQTLEALTRPGAREGLKRSLAEAVQPFVGRGTRVRVYLPQFVIQ